MSLESHREDSATYSALPLLDVFPRLDVHLGLSRLEALWGYGLIWSPVSGEELPTWAFPDVVAAIGVTFSAATVAGISSLVSFVDAIALLAIISLLAAISSLSGLAYGLQWPSPLPVLHDLFV